MSLKTQLYQNFGFRVMLHLHGRFAGPISQSSAI